MKWRWSSLIPDLHAVKHMVLTVLMLDAANLMWQTAELVKRVHG